ncbi:hypothetical protein Tco_1100327 [Tanacetum coccineum]
MAIFTAGKGSGGGEGGLSMGELGCRVKAGFASEYEVLAPVHIPQRICSTGALGLSNPDVFPVRHRLIMVASALHGWNMSFVELEEKFRDGTLQQIDEALDYRVKEFQINRTNPGMNTRFWTKKDVDRSKDFMFAIQKLLKTRRIFRNLESFMGGRIRDGDYRLLKRTE